MYNEETKSMFIMKCSNNMKVRESYRGMFEMTRPYEEELSKDLCQMSKDELSSVFNKLCGLKTNSINTRQIMIRNYLSWCKDNIEWANKEVQEIAVDNTEKMRAMSVVSPAHMQIYLNSVFDPESEESISNVYRCYFWMAYGGCNESDAIRVRTSDVDMSDMVFRIGYDEFPIYREAIKSFNNCVKLDSFKYMHPNYKKDVYIPRMGGDLLLRGIKTDISIKSFRVAINQKIKAAYNNGATTIKMSYQRAMMSGIFYRVYQLELIGIEPDFMDVAADYIKGREYNLSSGRNLIGARQRKIAKDYMNDYLKWKQTFIK